MDAFILLGSFIALILLG
ncbi:MAG: hypothetical protein RR726_30650, partial [Pseudomonas sp.]